jgi:4-amino-4-deoxy-L-arabinose transferase-like glycosyltransferase
MKKSLVLPPKWVTKLGLLFAFSIMLVLYQRLGRDALFDWDEGIYAELGRSLLAKKNIFTAFWNGAPWLEKPPGIAWVSAIGIALAGPSALGARLLMPLFAGYTLYIVYRIGTRLGSWKHGLLAAGVLATFNLFLGRTRAVNTDMPLLASITTTILFLLEKRPAWWVALAVAGGVWFKGIAGLLSVVIALPLLLKKSKKFLIHCALIILALIVPWHLYQYTKYGNEFLNPYFFEQVVRRVTVQIEFHFESRWYYLSYLYQNLGLGALLIAGLGAVSLFFKRKSLYLIWWVLAPLAIFTLAKTRLFWYILPIYPALALLIAEAIARWQQDKKSAMVITILALGTWAQALLLSSQSVEYSKTAAAPPDRIYIAQELGKLKTEKLVVLVPPSERLSEALLPEVARLSSSFRYGGMPSIVFYYAGPVEFFYDVDKFKAYWQEAQTPTALIAKDDEGHIPGSFNTVVSSPTYLGIQKGVYALR